MTNSNTSPSSLLRYLFFDTETHGKWVVQMAAILTDSTGTTINQFSTLIQSDGRPECRKYCLPVHGITAAKADHFGMPSVRAFETCLNFMGPADVLVAHNFSFDDRMLRTTGVDISPEALADIVEVFNIKETVCTMKGSRAFCDVKDKNGRTKAPKLTELYEILFDSPMPVSGQHDALNDADNTRKCFFELKKLGVL